jgi:hypothetical protein
MNKAQLIKIRTEREKLKYGKWASSTIDKPVNPILYQKIEQPEDIAHLRNTMVRGNYPLSMTDCEVVGINGDCGSSCPVLLNDNCPNMDEMVDAYHEEQIGGEK